MKFAATEPKFPALLRREFLRKPTENAGCSDAILGQPGMNSRIFPVLAAKNDRDGFAGDCVHHHAVLGICRFLRVVQKMALLRGISHILRRYSGPETLGETLPTRFSGYCLSSRFPGPGGRPAPSEFG